MNDPFLIVMFPLFLYSVIFHEIGHAYAALLNGDPTAKLRGRLTLNPIPHIDPMGLLFFIVSAVAGVGFGWAKPVPVNPMLFRDIRRGTLQTSLAGVGANAAIAVLSMVILKGLLLWTPSAAHALPGKILFSLASLNILLALFNIIPIPPLDGSRVAIVFMPRQMAESYARLQPLGFLLLFGLLALGGFRFVFAGAEYIVTLIAKLLGIF